MLTKSDKMYRQGLISIASNRQISDQIINHIIKSDKIISDITSTQTLLFFVNRPIGFLYIKIDERTALRMVSREMIIERINQLTGEVEYVMEIDNSYRFGKPPVYAIINETKLTAAQYQEYIKLAPYDRFQRREIVFIDSETGKRYKLLYTQEGHTISIEMQTDKIEREYWLPKWLSEICYQNDGELVKNYEALQTRRREKQIAEAAERREANKAKKDAEKARKLEEKKAKAAAKKALEKEKKKTENKTKKVTKSPKNTAKIGEIKKPVSDSKRKKKEETVADMWAEWRKGK